MVAKKLSNPVVAVVGADRRRRRRADPLPRAAQVSAVGAPAVCVGALGRQVARFPRQAAAGRGAHRQKLRRCADRPVLGRKLDDEEVREGGARRRHGHRRQLVRLPNGSDRAARRARDQSGKDRDAQRHHCEPELLGDHLDHAAVADPSKEPDQAADHLDVSGRVRRGRGRDGGAPRVDACVSRRQEVHAEGAAASVCVQRVQPQHEGRSARRCTTRKRRRSSTRLARSSAIQSWRSA